MRQKRPQLIKEKNSRGVELCGARSKTRGRLCRNIAMPNGRCYIHGGKSPGGKKGNTNTVTHGYYTATSIKNRAEFGELLKSFQGIIDDVEFDKK